MHLRLLLATHERCRREVVLSCVHLAGVEHLIRVSLILLVLRDWKLNLGRVLGYPLIRVNLNTREIINKVSE